MDVQTSDNHHVSLVAVFVVGTMYCRLLHWGPVLALSVTAIISWSASTCLLEWWPLTSPAAVLNLVVYILWHFLILYNFLLAIFVGPGYVPLDWKPVSKKFAYSHIYIRKLVDNICDAWHMFSC